MKKKMTQLMIASENDFTTAATILNKNKCRKAFDEKIQRVAVVAWSFLNNKVHIDDIKRERTKCKAISTVLLISIAVLASPLLLYSNTITGTTAYAQTPGMTFPPPIFGSIRSQPAYEVSIPFSSQGKSSFVPQEIAIPTGMTVIWFNNDDGQHSLSTLTNSTYSAPETINSGPIVQEGGSFIHTFTQPGKYVYFDQFNPSAQGVVNVGSTLQTGKNMNMIIGGQNTIPFNPAQPQSMVLSFIPTTVSIPPTTDITYKVTLLDSAKKALYSKNYDDADGILDLELVPVHKAVISSSTSNTTSASKNISSQFTSWGPDFIGEEQVRSDGVYHIRGPVLVQNSPYSIQVSIVAKDNAILPSPISDTFVLSPQSGK